MTNDKNIADTIKEAILANLIETAWRPGPLMLFAIPVDGSVLFGAVAQNGSKSVSFCLEPTDAKGIGQKLVNAAKEASK